MGDDVVDRSEGEVVVDAGVEDAAEVIGAGADDGSGARRRAEDAEAAARELGERVRELEAGLAAARAEAERAEASRAIDAALFGAGAVDVETARLLVERELGEGECGGVEEAVERVRRRKAFLFRSGDGRGLSGGSMGARPGSGLGGGEGVVEAAEEAALTGDRGALLRYLRARRGAV